MESKDQENADQEALVKKDPYVVTSQGEELKIILDPAQAASGSPSVTVIIQKPGGETAAQAGTGQNDKKGLLWA